MVPGSSGNDPLQVLAAAVTPVVLVSATAILISGVNSRYISIADRMRTLSHEFRDENCNPFRKSVISLEMSAFQRRVELVAWAVRTLYVAVVCFISDAMIISATSWRQTLVVATLPLFVTGIGLILVAVICELLELQISNRTIMLEVRDVVGHSHSPQT